MTVTLPFPLHVQLIYPVCLSGFDNAMSFYQDVLAGVVVLVSKEAVQHQGISLTMEGVVNLQLSSKSVGVFEAFYNSVKASMDYGINLHIKCYTSILIQFIC